MLAWPAHQQKLVVVKMSRSTVTLFEIAFVDRLVIKNALKSKFTDFEVSVLHESTRHAGVEYIITRVIKHFKKSQIPAFSPIKFLSMLKTLG